jgi:hypothetical protein
MCLIKHTETLLRTNDCCAHSLLHAQQDALTQYKDPKHCCDVRFWFGACNPCSEESAMTGGQKLVTLEHVNTQKSISRNLNHWVMHPVARVSNSIYRNLPMQQMSVLVLLCTFSLHVSAPIGGHLQVQGNCLRIFCITNHLKMATNRGRNM